MTEQSPLAEAQQKFIDAVSLRNLDAETITLDQAVGRILYNDYQAAEDSPAYHRAIVEGFLVHTAETKAADEGKPVSFKIVGVVKPGEEQCPAFGAGEAIEIMTGSVVADGPFSIVRMWEAERDDDAFTISRPFPPRFFIEDQGCDLKQGDTIITAGTALEAQHIGTLASLGINEIEVACRPRVAIFASGDEVVPHTDEQRPGMIRDCNSPMLAAAVMAAGGIADKRGIKGDTFGGFVAAVKESFNNHDMIVIAGGTAVNGRDFISDLLTEVGDLIIDGVPMRSGRPLIMGIKNNKPIVCVAGHPPEALRGFKLFAIPALAKLTGQDIPLTTDE